MKHYCKFRTEPVEYCPRPHSCPHAEMEVGHCTYDEDYFYDEDEYIEEDDE